ncbi:hypothetical protein Dsin_031946 [Dipteronia sinensis]|uniref:Cation/H(+) antiporter C-terminal domain-containing protein n=1 Tax=Dipteronia sinensis TaxID=43782 RepID=A0AAD9ZMI5_9ROSI|nr:hypothetical protein Dsin_031946 [Dipteronia sinensis]
MENGTTPLAPNMTHLYAVCEPYTESGSAGGLLWGKDPIKSTMTLSLLYIVLANALTAIFQLCLKPFGHITFIAEMLIQKECIICRTWSFYVNCIRAISIDLPFFPASHVRRFKPSKKTRKTIIDSLDSKNFLVVNLMFFVSTVGKLLGTVKPSLYYKMPVKDSISLGLILSCRGLFDILYIYRVKESKAVFTVPVIRAIWDTSRKYMAYNRRTIQHTKRQSELRVVVCIHELDNLSSVLNILEVCYPTRESPFAVYVLSLEELFGGLTPLFISHRYQSVNSGKPTRASGIIKCFDQYEEQKQRRVDVECFTSVAPYPTMHNDICSLANEKGTALIIFPFQNFENSYIRGVNKHVLDNAPWSVAIFFGHGILAEPRFLYSDIMVSVCCVFIGGPDDREAPALGSRMVENPCIRLTIARFVEVDQTSGVNMAEIIQDAEAISTFKMKTYKKIQVNEVSYKEEKISQVADTTRVLQSMENEFRLMLVGRRHDDNSMILKGLSEWTEIEELGAVGDLMLSWDVSRASILVVQQQALVVEEMLDKPKQL